MEKYELDWTRYHPENSHHTLIAILTGHDIEDIREASTKKHGWRAKDFKEAFKNLGFNVSDRFVKFDPETKFPCLMRYQLKGKSEKCWYAAVYYDGKVQEGNSQWEFDDWLKYHRRYRVTSMLQVWI